MTARQLRITSSLCRNDGMCVESCPVGVLAMAADGSGPVAVQPERCVHCGHCAAVCPMRALEWDDMPSAALTPIDPTATMIPAHVEQWLRARRSIRVFRRIAIPRERIEAVLQSARWAPTGHNRQHVAWTVLEGADKVAALASAVIEWMRGALKADHPAARRLGFAGLVARWDLGQDPICRRAPHLLLAHASSAEPAAAGSCAIAVTYAQLAAMAHGLGTCWAGYVMAAMSLDPSLGLRFGVPQSQQVFAATLLGQAKYTYRAIPDRRPLQVSWQ